MIVLGDEDEAVAPVRRKRSARPEERLHRAIVHYLTLVSKQAKFYFLHVPNGGMRTKAEAGIFKALGVKAGVADLLIIGPFGKAYWVELKAANGRQTPSQSEFETAMRKLGCEYAIIRDIDALTMKLRDWGLIT